MIESDAADPILEEQTRYYRVRDLNPDDWFYRRGTYDHGPTRNRDWFRDAVELMQALSGFNPKGHVLEIGGGTGLWTRQLVLTADHVTVVDVSERSLALNRIRLGSLASRVRYVERDIFSWPAGEGSMRSSPRSSFPTYRPTASSNSGNSSIRSSSPAAGSFGSIRRARRRRSARTVACRIAARS